MVDVGMGEQHEVDPAEVEVERLEVPAAGAAAALEHAAIDQEGDAVGVHPGARPGDLAGCAEERQLHAKLLRHRSSREWPRKHAARYPLCV